MPMIIIQMIWVPDDFMISDDDRLAKAMPTAAILGSRLFAVPLARCKS